MTDYLFIPTRAAALAGLEAFTPHMGRAYAQNRNTDYGPDRPASVSRLSPYVRYRVLGEWEMVGAAANAHQFSTAEKFLQEVFWRTYWKGWLERRPNVWGRYKQIRDQDRASVPGKAVQKAEEGRTGIDCFDTWAEELVETGYLHNHARMWFASIWIFTLKLPWSLGADFFMRHLLDADPASNTLSWRWVAGLQTQGKTYLARADNIATFTDGRFPETPRLASHAPAIEDTFDVGTAGPMPQSDIAREGGTVGLLLTPEDLSQDSVVENPAAYGLYLPRDAVSNHAFPFVEALVRDRLPEAPLLRTPDDVVDWAHAAGVETVATAYIPVGPLADQIGHLKDALSNSNIHYSELLRDWDRECWQYATKGFFPFKKHIPSLMAKLL